jgi:23S rRNA (uracil1939-C5)-methyltransferase
MRRFNSHEVVPIRECLISNPVISNLSSIFRGEVFAAKSNIDKINIRCSDKYNQIMLLCIYQQDAPVIPVDVHKLEDIPGVVSVFRCVESGSGHLGKFTLEYGEPVIREEVRGIEYRIGPECFFQVNKLGLEKLVHLVRDFAGTDNNLVVDAHCGVGTFALQIADISDVVIGRDVSPPAVALAQSNAEDNGITNASFDVGRVSQLFGKKLHDADIDLVVLDPPRQGCEKTDLRGLIRAQPKSVIYVSCNPTTMARDMHELTNAGYQLLRLAMVDMFPMTYHLETVALCDRAE